MMEDEVLGPVNSVARVSRQIRFSTGAERFGRIFFCIMMILWINNNVVDVNPSKPTRR